MKKALFLLILSFFGLVQNPLPSHAQEEQRVVPESQEALRLSYAPVVKKISPAVVNIYAKRMVERRVNPFMADPFFGQFFGNLGGMGLSQKQVESSLGSGVIVDGKGMIVTNAHVVENAQDVMVVLNDGREFPAKISLADPRSDLAILRVDPKGETLPHAPLAPSESLEVGDLVLAIGNPFGVGQTVTSGIISALARSAMNINDFNFFIQTDAAINPGNSGGPLVSMDGRVIGINTAIFSQSGGSLGIGFAIPSEMVSSVITAEKSGSHTGVVRTWIGVQGQEVTPDIAQSLGLEKPQGVLVNKIHPLSPLREKGLKAGDVITTINDKPIHSPAELKFRLATIPIGDTIRLDFIRNSQKTALTSPSIAPPESPPRKETSFPENSLFAGVSVANINPAVAIEYGFEEDTNGLVITKTAPRAGQMAAILKSGDILLSINEIPLVSTDDLKTLLAKPLRGGTLALTFNRNGRKTQIVLR